MDNCDKFKEMMMGLMDDELTPAESAEVNKHLERCRSCRNEYEELKKSSNALKGLTYHASYDVELDKVWKSPYGRFAKLSGILMVIISWIFITGYSLILMLTSETKETIPKVTSFIFILGILILLITVIRERLKTYKNDPYKEVDR